MTNQSNIEIQTSFENVTVASGKSVIFICTFSKSIDCNWERNGIKISIEARYAYLDTEMGMNTKNCSIIITNVTSLDVGQWTCGNLATSKIRAVQLANFHLDLIVQSTQVELIFLFLQTCMHSYKLVNIVFDLIVEEPSFPKIIYNNDPITELMLFSVDLNENLSCTSQNGYPAPRLYWKVAEYKIHKLLQEEDGDDNNLYNSTLNWNILSEMHYLINASELQCIAEHPLFLQPKIATLKIIRTSKSREVLAIQISSFVQL